MQITADLEKRIDTLPIRRLFTQGEANVDRIEIRIPYTVYDGKNLSSFIYRMRAVNLDRDLVLPDQTLPKTVGGGAILLTWTITSVYTQNPGRIAFEIVGSNSSGQDIIKFTGPPVDVRETLKSYSGEIDFTQGIIDQLMLQFGQYVQQAKDQADRSEDQADRAEHLVNSIPGTVDKVYQDALKKSDALYNNAVKKSDALHSNAVKQTEALYKGAVNRADALVDKAVNDATRRVNAAANYALEQGDYAKDIGENLLAMKEAGLFKGEKGDTGPQGEQGPQGIQGPKGEKGDRGDSGITVPVSGIFTLAGDADGNLWAYYADGSNPPEFEVTEDGDIYYITPDE